MVPDTLHPSVDARLIRATLTTQCGIQFWIAHPFGRDEIRHPLQELATRSGRQASRVPVSACMLDV